MISDSCHRCIEEVKRLLVKSFGVERARETLIHEPGHGSDHVPPADVKAIKAFRETVGQVLGHFPGECIRGQEAFSLSAGHTRGVSARRAPQVPRRRGRPSNLWHPFPPRLL
jgi:hypothetical protein